MDIYPLSQVSKRLSTSLLEASLWLIQIFVTNDGVLLFRRTYPSEGGAVSVELYNHVSPTPAPSAPSAP